MIINAPLKGEKITRPFTELVQRVSQSSQGPREVFDTFLSGERPMRVATGTQLRFQNRVLSLSRN